MCCLRITGFLGAIIELALFSRGSSLLHYYVNFHEIDIVSYYWVMFTILTGIWKAVFITQYSTSVETSHALLDRLVQKV